MLFSHPEVSKYVRENMIAAWESVRPVPTATIDFGNGRKVVRTMNGNIATYVCSPDGYVIDVIPGLVSPERYLLELGQAVQTWIRLDDLARDVPRMHASLLAATTPRFELEESVTRRLDPVRDLEMLVRNSRDPAFSSFSKTEVELPTKVAFGLEDEESHLDELTREPADLSLVPVSRASDERAAREALATRSAPSKLLVERGTKHALGLEPLLLAREDMDESSKRKPLVHRLLCERLVEPKDISKRVYEEILHVDLDDPWLGLAIDVFDGGAYGKGR